MTKQLYVSSSKLEIVSVPIKVVISFHFCPEQCRKSKKEHYGLVVVSCRAQQTSGSKTHSVVFLNTKSSMTGGGADQVGSTWGPLLPH